MSKMLDSQVKNVIFNKGKVIGYSVSGGFFDKFLKCLASSTEKINLK